MSLGQGCICSCCDWVADIDRDIDCPLGPIRPIEFEGYIFANVGTQYAHMHLRYYTVLCIKNFSCVICRVVVLHILNCGNA